MFTLRRYFSVNRALLKRIDPKISKTYTKLFEHSSFQPIKNHIPKDSDEIEPYDMSSRMREIIQDMKIQNKEAALIHNKLIEGLSKYNYGIATIHSKLLQDIGQVLSIEALLEVVKYNPGRLRSSWDLFVDYKKTINTVPDELLSAVLEKVVFFDSVDIEDGKEALTLGDLSKSCYLIDKLQDKKFVTQKIVDKLTSNALEQNVTICLPTILKYSKSFDVLSSKIADLTPIQVFYVSEAFPFSILKKWPTYIHTLVKTTGTNEKLTLEETELEVKENYVKEVDQINSQLGESIVLQDSIIDKERLEHVSDKILKELETSELLKENFDLFKSILRIFSISKLDTAGFSRFYNMFESAYLAKKEDLEFEKFLASAYLAYTKADESLLDLAQDYIPQTSSEEIRVNVVRTLLVVNAKFNIDNSLEMFNETIPYISREVNEITSLSPADLVTEALILAYLSKADIDFARMIMDQAMGEKVFSGKIALKEIKAHLSGYGDAVENDNLDQFIENEVRTYLESL